MNATNGMLLLASEPHAVPLGTTLFFTAILAVMIACLALEEKIHARKSLIVGLFAMVTLLLGEMFGLVHRDPVEFLGHTVDLPVYIPGIDWGVIAIILGSSLFVDATSKTGLFGWIGLRKRRRLRDERRRDG